MFFPKFSLNFREFWQMNIVEILTELTSDKKDHEIYDGLIARLFNDDFKKDRAETLANEAAEFLLKYRKDIKLLCKIRKVFEKEAMEPKIKKEKGENYRPTNFRVSKGKFGTEEEDYLGEIGGEEVMMVDNYQILSKILVILFFNLFLKKKRRILLGFFSAVFSFKMLHFFEY